MKIIKSYVFFLLLIFSIICCKKNHEIQVDTNNFSKIKQMNWLLGNWENLSNESYFKEIWSTENDSTLIAKSFITVKKDTVFYETINLIQCNDSLFYIVSLKDQNDAKPISFLATSMTKNKFVFENVKHDFPSKITYTKITSDSLVAEISGIKDGKVATEIFPMHKKKLQ